MYNRRMLPPALTSFLDQLDTGIILLEMPGHAVSYIHPALSSRRDLSSAEALQTFLQPLPSQSVTIGDNTYRLYIVNDADNASDSSRLSQTHRDFVSTVSHEFRTPLTSIKGFADTLLQYGSKLDSEQQQRFIHIIRDQADRLIRLVEALLEVSKNGNGRLDIAFRPVALKPLAERITQSIAIKSTVPHPFVIDIPGKLAPVWADPDKLEQVLINLIDNAVKYSQADKTITLRACETLEGDEERILIEVIDEGIGIPETHLEKLFTQFYRIEGPLTQKVEGTGLGLYIVKSLVSAMDGHIGVSSTLGRGSVFYLTLPLATMERQAAYHRKRCAEDTSHAG